MAEKRNLILREFGALNTQAARQVIGDKEFSWISEWMPIGHGNMKLVPGASAPIATITVADQSIVYQVAVSLNGGNYLYEFLSDGSCYEVSSDTGTVIKVAPAGTFSNSGPRACQWENDHILIVDQQNGYFSYDRLSLISYQDTIYSVDIINPGSFPASPAVAPFITTGGGGGTGATFAATLGASTVTSISAGGTNYQVGDILNVTPDGSTVLASPNPDITPATATIRVTSVGASNAVTGAVIEVPGTYTTSPTNNVAVTGGYGSGATFKLGFTIIDVAVTNIGKGYTTIPTLLINPPGGSGSSMNIATVGDYTILPTSPVTTTGGSGSGLTLTMTFGLVSVRGIFYVPYNGGALPPGAYYATGDILTLTGGTFTVAATVQITFGGYYNPATAWAFGYSIISAGHYTAWPASGIFGTTGGHGSGAEIGYDPVQGNHPSLAGAIGAIIVATGSGYTNGNILTIVGGTHSIAATVTYLSYGASGGAVLSANLALNISGTAIASYSGRVWIVNSQRTVVFSSPDSFDDFDTADGAGSFIFTDEQMKSQITALEAANDYLYISGLTSMYILNGVALQTPPEGTAGSPITTFNLNNLTTSFGTGFPDAMLPYYRSMAFASTYGWYMLTGVTPQKISDNLDGLLNDVDLQGAQLNGIPVTGGQCLILGQFCNCWLVQYEDPLTSTTYGLLLILFNGKWFTSIQNSGLELVTGGVYNGVPTLFGTDGKNIYRLFSDTTTPREFRLQTKQWDMGNPVMTKQVTRFGMETTVQNATTFTVSFDTEAYSTSKNVVFASAGYYYSVPNPISVTGNYIGMTITGEATPGDILTGLYLEYAEQTQWARKNTT